MQTENKLAGYPSIDKPWLKYYSEEAINTPLPTITAYEYIFEQNKDVLDDTALIYFKRKISYGKMFEYIDKVANVFACGVLCKVVRKITEKDKDKFKYVY